jgi:hypothetical protein
MEILGYEVSIVYLQSFVSIPKLDIHVYIDLSFLKGRALEFNSQFGPQRHPG